MTDKIKGLVVTFEKDIRDDDVVELVNAISLLKGVVSVKKSIGNVDDQMNRERVEHNLKIKLFEVLK